MVSKNQLMTGFINTVVVVGDVVVVGVVVVVGEVVVVGVVVVVVVGLGVESYKKDCN